MRNNVDIQYLFKILTYIKYNTKVIYFAATFKTNATLN